MILIPSVIESDGRSNRAFSLIDKLFDENIIILENEINDDVAQVIKIQLLYLEAKEDCKEINMYISSPGGSVYAGNGIIDVMRHIKTPVNTICTGIAMSMGNQILSAGTGIRSAMPNARIMIHSIRHDTGGKIQDTRIQHKEGEFLQERLMRQMAEYTKGKTSYEDILKLTDRDKFLTPEQAIEIGLIDSIVK